MANDSKIVSRNIRLTPELHQQLVELKMRTGLTHGQMVRFGLKLAIDRYQALLAEPETTQS